MNGYTRLAAALILSVLLLVLAFFVLDYCSPVLEAADSRITVTVRDFSKGMTPVMSAFTNDPERIVYSENLYSIQPGTRQLRFGRAPFVTYAAAGDPNDSTVDALALFAPSDDSSALVYAAGGYYHRIKTGTYSYRIWGFGSRTTLAEDTSIAIYPYNGGDSVTIDADTSDCGVKGYGTNWLRYLQPGDSITFDYGDSTWSHTIKFVIADDSLELNDTIRDTGSITMVMDSVSIQRLYTQGGQEPYLLQAGDFMYTGTNADPPQIIFSEDDSLMLRPLGIVDSFYVDSMYYDFTDAVRGNGLDTVLDWGGDTVVTVWTRLQVVDRSKNWVSNAWSNDVFNSSRSYYARLGIAGGADRHKQKVYQIAGNSDSSLYLVTNLIDTSSCVRCTSSYGHWPNYAVDTLSRSELDGTWGYIYSTTGAAKTVFDNDATTSMMMINGGAYFATTQNLIGSSNPDSLNYGNYWIHLLEPVSLPQVGDIYEFTYKHMYSPKYNVEPKDWGIGDSVWGGEIVAVQECCYPECRYDIDIEVAPDWCMQIFTGTYAAGARPAQVMQERFFHISWTERDGDTIIFHTDGPVRVTDTLQASSDTTWVSEWEVVKAEMPYFGGMAEFDNRLMGWGDSLQPGAINMSLRFSHWNWAQVDDDGTPLEFFLANATSDPIVNIVPYDDQAVVYRTSTILSYPGFEELSLSEGLAAPRAVVGLNKYLYWLDIDGVYRIQRRDFSGYSIQKISYDIDPILNAWHQNIYGGTVSPAIINPEYRHKSIMVHNQRDRHLYLFFPEGSSTTNNYCLTYDLQREQWDGVFTLPAASALWATVDDTSRILLGSNDSAFIEKLDYSYLDEDTIGIDSHLKSGGFGLSDPSGLPIKARLDRIDFSMRGVSGGIDSVLVIVGHWGTYGDGADTLKVTTLSADYPDIADNFMKRCYNSTSAYWDWEVKSFGRNGGVSTFQPFELKMTFLPLRKDGR